MKVVGSAGYFIRLAIAEHEVEERKMKPIVAAMLQLELNC